MNESLRRALLRARLTEEDVAARLEVDPKTVRRWLEGRLPYQRHRWVLAAMLGIDETDIWPRVGAAPSRSEEILAIYPHCEDVPRELWRRLRGSAETEISILDVGGLFLTEDPDMITCLGRLGKAGVRVRICLADPDTHELAVRPEAEVSADKTAVPIRDMLAMAESLRATGAVEIRLHQGSLNVSIYRVDGEVLVVQHAYGIPARRAPVLHLRRAGSADMIAIYLNTFERVWRSART